MADYLSEAVTVRGALESVRGVSPTTGWVQFQIDVGGVQALQRNYQDVERNIHSVNATNEKGDHVQYTVEPQLVHDCNKDFFDETLEPTFRCNAKHLGGTGQSKFRPTAVTATGYTVAANGAIPSNVLIYARGFTNAANDGLKNTTASVGTEIKASGLVVEASPPANATVDAVGLQGVANDIGITAQGHLTSAGGINFTTLGLVVGDWIYLPTPAEATAMGNVLFSFSTAIAPSGSTLGTNCGFARITAIASAQLTLERHTFTIVADLGTGAGEIIRVFMPSRFYRNYALDDTTNYNAKTMTFEKEDIKPNVGADTRYTYVHGCGPNSLQIASPINSKITATLAMMGMTATNPVAAGSRKAGASTAFAPLTKATALVDAQNDLETVRIGQVVGGVYTTLLTEFNEWTYTHGNNITPKQVQGVYGAADLNYGKFNDQVSVTGYHSNSDMINAVDENRDTLWWDVSVRNHQFGWLIDMPNAALRNPQLAYAGNQPVMISGDVMAFRNIADGIQTSMCVFGYLPTA